MGWSASGIKRLVITSLVSIRRETHLGVVATFLILLFRKRHSRQPFAQDLSLSRKINGVGEEGRTKKLLRLRHRGEACSFHASASISFAGFLMWTWVVTELKSPTHWGSYVIYLPSLGLNFLISKTRKIIRRLTSCHGS